MDHKERVQTVQKSRINGISKDEKSTTPIKSTLVDYPNRSSLLLTLLTTVWKVPLPGIGHRTHWQKDFVNTRERKSQKTKSKSE